MYSAAGTMPSALLRAKAQRGALRSIGCPNPAQTTQTSLQQAKPPQRKTARRVVRQCPLSYASQSNLNTLCRSCVHSTYPPGVEGNVPVRQHRCFSSLSAARDPESPSPTVPNQPLKPVNKPLHVAGGIARHLRPSRDPSWRRRMSATCIVQHSRKPRHSHRCIAAAVAKLKS